ncbi:hypothetical protein [Sphingobacterium hungaricum]
MKISKILFYILCLLIICYQSVNAQELDVKRSSLGKLSAPALNEVSGMVASRENPESFWVHNDSGDEARFFLIDKQANLKATYYLDSIEAVDFEDIAWLQMDQTNYLLLADIGDNRAVRNEIKLYLIKEPKSDSADSIYHIPSDEIRTIVLNYPDKARDAEAIFVDPVDQSVFIISKRDFKSGLYQVNPFTAVKKDHYVLKKIGEFPFSFVTAADISPDGSEILLKNLVNIYSYKREKQQPVQRILSKNYVSIPYSPEPQGESITFDLNGKDFYTVSERPFGLDAYLYLYKR